MDIDVPNANDFIADDNESGAESQPANNENLDNELPENPEGEQPEGDEGKKQEEESEDEKVPFHKHPRWIERQKEFKQLREANEKLLKENEGLKNTKQPEPVQLNDEQRNELREILKGGPKHTFEQDYKSWDEAYQAIAHAVIEDFMYLQGVFNQRAQQMSQKQTESLENDKRSFALEMMDIEDEMEPEDFKEFRAFATEELSKLKDGAQIETKTFLKDALYRYYKGKSTKQPTTQKPNLNKNSVSKVVGKGKPSVGGSKQPSYEYISGRSMSEIAQDMMGGN